MGFRKIPGTGIIVENCWFLPILTGTFVVVAGLLGCWWLLGRGAVLSYGGPGSVYFVPAEAVEGQKIQLWFDGAAWLRRCQTDLYTTLTPFKGPPLDLVVHTIDVPKKTGPLARKAREWIVPELGADREEGPAIMTGHADGHCFPLLDQWKPVVTDLPAVKLEWRRRR